MQSDKWGFLFPPGETVDPLTVFWTKALQYELTMLHLSDDW